MNFIHAGSRVMAGMKSCSLAICYLAVASSVAAQGPPVPPGGTVVAAGLEGPRGLVFGPDGLLYLAEAGLGGTNPVPDGCEKVPPPVGPYHGGLTARVSRIESNGERTTVVDGLPSGMSQFAQRRYQWNSGYRFRRRRTLCSNRWWWMLARQSKFSELCRTHQRKATQRRDRRKFEPIFSRASGPAY